MSLKGYGKQLQSFGYEMKKKYWSQKVTASTHEKAMLDSSQFKKKFLLGLLKDLSRPDEMTLHLTLTRRRTLYLKSMLYPQLELWSLFISCGLNLGNYATWNSSYQESNQHR